MKFEKECKREGKIFWRTPKVLKGEERKSPEGFPIFPYGNPLTDFLPELLLSSTVRGQ